MEIKEFTKTILVIEDDEFLRQIMVRKLKSAGYEVHEAMSGEKGMEIAQENPPDLILLDLILPGISGFEVIALLHQQEKTVKIPIIVFSNYAEQESMKRTKEMGVYEYLIKAEMDPSGILDHVNRFFINNNPEADTAAKPTLRQ